MRFLKLNLSAKVHCCFVLLLLLFLFFFLPLSIDVFMLWGRDLFDKKP